VPPLTTTIPGSAAIAAPISSDDDGARTVLIDVMVTPRRATNARNPQPVKRSGWRGGRDEWSNWPTTMEVARKN
jgi:hypothetical protein